MLKIRRGEYNEERWATDRDGYLICGTCYEKRSGEICTNCFCKVCYISVDEYCNWSPYEWFFLEKMKCLLCGLNCLTEKVKKKHVDYHQIKENDTFFKDLFLPDTLEKKCKFCDIIFKTCRQKKYICFFFITVKNNSLVEGKVHYQ